MSGCECKREGRARMPGLFIVPVILGLEEQLECDLQLPWRVGCGDGAEVRCAGVGDDAGPVAAVEYVERIDLELEADMLTERYFARRADGLQTLRGEELLVAIA